MTITLFRAAMTAGLMLGFAAGTAVAQSSAPKLTASVGQQLNAAQTAGKAKDYPGALAAIEKAKGISSKKPYDELWIYRIEMNTYIQMQDMVNAAKAAEAAADLDPAAIPDAEKAGVYKPALQLALNQKHYDKAGKYAKLFLATTPPPSAADRSLATRALFFSGDYAGATAMAQQSIDAATAAGQKPNRDDLDIVMNAQVKQNDQPGAEKTLETLVTNYGDADDWKQILGVSLSTKGMRDVDYIYVGRLWPLTGAPMAAADASLFGSTASKLGLYGDAVNAVKQGGTVTPDPAPRAEADKKTIPAQIAAGKGKEGGQYNVKLAQALYGYGMYAEAEAAAKLAQTKGGATDPTEAPMMIGMSQAAQNNYADAATTFAGITAANPASARVVRLWTAYVKQKAAPAQ